MNPQERAIVILATLLVLAVLGLIYQGLYIRAQPGKFSDSEPQADKPTSTAWKAAEGLRVQEPPAAGLQWLQSQPAAPKGGAPPESEKNAEANAPGEAGDEIAAQAAEEAGKSSEEAEVAPTQEPEHTHAEAGDGDGAAIAGKAEGEDTQGADAAAEQAERGARAAPPRDQGRGDERGQIVSYADNHPKTVQPAPQRRSDIVVGVSRSSYKPGRAGHVLKDLAAAVALAKMYNFTLARPFNFDAKLVGLFKMDAIADRLGPLCKSAPEKLHFNDSLWDGFMGGFQEFQQYAWTHNLTAGRIDQGQFCVQLELSWRILPHQLYEWELQGQVSAGTYDAVIETLRKSLLVNRTSHSYWNASDQRLQVVVHQRRGDISQQKKALGIFKKAVSFLARGYRDVGPIQITWVTEPEENDDVVNQGCVFPPEWFGGSSVSCQVKSGSIEADFAAMLFADVLIVSSSSLSTWAGLLGTQQAVYWMPYLDYHAHPILGRQFFTPCKEPKGFQCLDFVGDLDFRPCNCTGHRQRVAALMSFHVQRRILREERHKAWKEKEEAKKEAMKKKEEEEERKRNQRPRKRKRPVIDTRVAGARQTGEAARLRNLVSVLLSGRQQSQPSGGSPTEDGGVAGNAAAGMSAG